MSEKKYIQLKDLEVYKEARGLSRLGWSLYTHLDWQTKKIIGDQYITATDSVGANIAEGYGRYHYLDKIKFLHTARGSLWEGMHWTQLLQERNLITEKDASLYNECSQKISFLLQKFINSLYTAKSKPKS